MKIRGLVALLVAGLLSCTQAPDVITKQYNIPDRMLVRISNKKVYIVQDVDGDGRPDVILQYDLEGDTKPGALPGDPEDYFMLDHKEIKAWIPPLNQGVYPIIPEERFKSLKDSNLKASY